MSGKFQGRLLDLSRGMNGKQRITIELAGDFRENYNRLKDDEIMVEIKKRRKQRSLDANAYCWVLIDGIAEAIGQDKIAVYREAIRNIAGVSEIVCTTEKAAPALISAWKARGLGWQAEPLPSKLAGCVNVVLHFGSSTYDTKQMGALLDYLISEAKELGVDTISSDELETCKTEWGKHL